MKRVVRSLLAVVAMIGLGAPAGAAERGAVPLQPFERQQGVAPPLEGGGCVPVTCEQAKATCGMISDGCGKVVDCAIVKSVTVAVDPASHTGLCPRTYTFTATITANRKGTVRYEWANAPLVSKKGQVEVDPLSPKKVVFGWPAPANLAPGSQWLAITVADENGCDSAGPVKASFSQKCTVMKPDGLGTLPQDFTRQ